MLAVGCFYTIVIRHKPHHVLNFLIVDSAGDVDCLLDARHPVDSAVVAEVSLDKG